MNQATKQPGLFDPPSVDQVSIRPHYADLGDGPRLAKHNERLLKALRHGPMTNVELAMNRHICGLNYRARISDVRAWLQNNTGETIACAKGKGGLNTYRITRRSLTDDKSTEANYAIP